MHTTRPKLVILDGFATNPGDLSWAALQELADCTIHPRSAPAEVAARIHQADAVMLNKAPLSAESIAAAPDLKYVGILATGYNTIDLEAAHARGIVVRNVPGYSTRSVAQHAFALLLELANQSALHSRDVHAGGWSRNPDYTYTLAPLVELDGLTLGVIGFGAIGRAVAEIAKAFGMRILVSRRNMEQSLPDGMTYATLEQVFMESDALSLHCPLTPETHHIVNEARLRTMKPTAWLINTARGPLVDEPALAAALQKGRIAGAGLDVLSVEPPPADHPLLHAPNCVITPHIAWNTPAARRRLIDIAVENYRAFLQGRPNAHDV